MIEQAFFWRIWYQTRFSKKILIAHNNSQAGNCLLNLISCKPECGYAIGWIKKIHTYLLTERNTYLPTYLLTYIFTYLLIYLLSRSCFVMNLRISYLALMDQCFISSGFKDQHSEILRTVLFYCKWTLVKLSQNMHTLLIVYILFIFKFLWFSVIVCENFDRF